MPKYIIETKEVWTQKVEVEASSKEDALRRYNEGEGIVLENEFSDFEYSHTLGNEEEWDIYEKDSE